jgi:hypothetical protein
VSAENSSDANPPGPGANAAAASANPAGSQANPPVLSRTEKVAAINAALARYDANFMDVTHTLTAGVYTRTGRVKAGQVIIGFKHRARNIFTLYRGSVAVWDADNGVRVINAPYSEITPPGRQRIGVVLSDIEGANIFETGAKNHEQAEAEMLFPFSMVDDAGEIIMQMSEKILSENSTKQKLESLAG